MKASQVERTSNAQLQEQIAKCLNSARVTIEIVYDVLQHQDFFRTWYVLLMSSFISSSFNFSSQTLKAKVIYSRRYRFYNTHYTIFAAATILVYLFRAPEESKCDALYRQVEMAIEILETMEESAVAAKAAMLIQTALAKARQRTSLNPENALTILGDSNISNILPLNGLWGPFNVAYDDPSSDVRFQFSDFGPSCNLFEDIIGAIPP